jgi:hypothetical protein
MCLPHQVAAVGQVDAGPILVAFPDDGAERLRRQVVREVAHRLPRRRVDVLGVVGVHDVGEGRERGARGQVARVDRDRRGLRGAREHRRREDEEERRDCDLDLPGDCSLSHHEFLLGPRQIERAAPAP